MSSPRDITLVASCDSDRLRDSARFITSGYATNVADSNWSIHKTLLDDPIQLGDHTGLEGLKNKYFFLRDQHTERSCISYQLRDDLNQTYLNMADGPVSAHARLGYAAARVAFSYKERS